jgi:hypothetical protein
MAWLPFYAAESDYLLLRDFLSDEPDVAFVISDGSRRWRAVATVAALEPGRYCLWHIPSGPLPLIKGGKAQPDLIINPFAGWHEKRPGADPSSPYFGPGHPGVFWLNVRPDEFGPHSGVRAIGLSSFEWIGNHYKALGSVPIADTERWWKRLGSWIRRRSTQVPRGGVWQKAPPEIWAFPAAYSLMETTAIGGNN